MSANLLQECRSSVKRDLDQYEQMVLERKLSFILIKTPLDAEANRLRALLDSIDALAGQPTEALPGVEGEMQDDMQAWHMLKFIQRVLESKAPQQDIDAAIGMARTLRQWSHSSALASQATPTPAPVGGWRPPSPVRFEFDKRKPVPDGYVAWTVMQMHQAFADGKAAQVALSPATPGLVPLTESTINAVFDAVRYDSGHGTRVDLVRALESAHGIYPANATPGSVPSSKEGE